MKIALVWYAPEVQTWIKAIHNPSKKTVRVTNSEKGEAKVWFIPLTLRVQGHSAVPAVDRSRFVPQNSSGWWEGRVPTNAPETRSGTFNVGCSPCRAEPALKNILKCLVWHAEVKFLKATLFNKKMCHKVALFLRILVFTHTFWGISLNPQVTH